MGDKFHANLVLTSSERSRPPSDEATGEVETLAGRISHRMGDRVQHTKPVKKEKKKKPTSSSSSSSVTKSFGARTKTTIDRVDIDESYYKPRTKETKQVFDQFLHFMQRLLGDAPQSVVRSGTDEVLALLKNENLKDADKKRDIESLVGRISMEDFTKLMTFARGLTDYSEDRTIDMNDAEREISVNFVDSDEESGSSDDEIRDDSESEEDEGEDTTAGTTLGGDEEAMDIEKAKQQSLDVDAKQIDAYWLQREVSKFIQDPLAAQNISENILKALQEKTSKGACENRLCNILGYDRFDFVKILIKNRMKIYFCTQLARAEGDARKAIEQQMADHPEGTAILEELKSGKDKKRGPAKPEARAKQAKLQKGDVFAEGKQMLDLDSLAFTQGSHVMSNKKCELPKGSVLDSSNKSWQEVRIPAPRHPEFSQGEKLVPITELPEWAQKAFPPSMKVLNRIQSRVYKAVFEGADNILLCAPTGAGKTNVAVLSMLHEIGLHIDENGEVDRDAFKIIYIAPMKALVQELVGNFSKRLAPFGIVVKELTGDQNLTKQQISETQVIVTTPEKWDIVTRKSGDRTYTQLVRLIIMDEIHLLHDERGPVLESIIARTIRNIEQTQEMVRLLGLSATLPNYEDVATLLRVKDHNLFAFDSTFRPVPLQQIYIGVKEKKPLKRMQVMNEITYAKVMENAGTHQVLVFVHSRKETVKTAKAIRDMALENDAIGVFLKEESSRSILQHEAEETAKSADLKDLLPYGFGVHHAGMSRVERTLVEDLFADGHIQVLVSTATLAWGVNLPAHTVIIKGTQIYNPEKGRWVELSALDVMQMIGRAGRPAFDTEGVGILITTDTELQFYLSLQNNQLPIESQFLSRLPDQLNAEIVLGTIQNAKDAIEWLSYTYLYICMLRNPPLYGIAWDEKAEDPKLEKRRADLIHTAATILDKHNMIKYDRRTGSFQVTDLGRVASYYYVTHSSMAIFFEHLKPTMSDIELFRLFSLSSEFKYLVVRDEEKVDLEKLLEKVPIPVKESIEEPSAKVNVLLQAYISQSKLEGLALISDMVYVQQSASRILRALFEIILKRGWAQLAEKTLTLCKMVERRMWVCQSPLRQFKDIPEVIIKKLERKDFPMDRLYDLNAGELGELIHFPTQGKNLFRKVHQFPRLDLSAHVQPITRSLLRVELTIIPDFIWDAQYHGKAQGFWIIVEDVDGENILHSEYFILKEKIATSEHEREQTISFTVSIYEPLPPQYFVKVISDRWLGAETTLPISFRHLILPEKYPPSTELLDLQPLPLKALGDPEIEKLYEFQYFNPIQTQVFSALFKSDDNVLIAAPPGSGKTLCAEIAMYRLFRNKPAGKVVYIGPIQSIVTERLEDWKEKFEGLKNPKRVAELTGEITQDLKILEKADIVLSTPERWDLISRRWKARKSVINIDLFIVDELHLLGGPSGPTLEVIVSRTRQISAYLKEFNMKHDIRIVGLAASLANGRDVGQWIGCESKNIFNFRPDTRPVPLEIHIQGFDLPHFESCILAMTKPAINAVTAHAKDKPVLLFAPSRKHAIRIANDILLNTLADNNAKRYLKVSDEEIKKQIDQVINPIVKKFLEFGIGIFHEGLNDTDKIIVSELHKSGIIQVAVATNTSCWGLTMTAHVVIIMGTQYFDGKEHRYVDYQITDILQMMGRANVKAQDEAAVCVLLCHAPKKEFYKKFIYEPLPVESHLDLFLANHINAEVVTKSIENKQAVIDYITWTFLYYRLTQNPNYYNLHGVSNQHLSEHLSEMVEGCLENLENAKCISVEDDNIVPMNQGMISAYYYLDYTTIELFSNSLNAKVKLRSLIEVLSAATEFNEVPVRHREPGLLRKIAAHLPQALEKPDYLRPRTKVNILLQSYFSRRPLPVDMQSDLAPILETSIRLIQAMVDVISSNGWLDAALLAMELSQMVTQAIWNTDSPLKQLPHVNDEFIKLAKDAGVETIWDLTDLEDADRDKLLSVQAKLNKKQQLDIAKACNRYPSIDVKYDVTGEIEANEQVVVNVQLEREREEGLAPVYAPHYPKEKQENWWLAIGDTKTKQLMAIKRIVLQKAQKVKLDFTAPGNGGTYDYKLYFMCDSYSGCDQEYKFKLNVLG